MHYVKFTFELLRDTYQSWLKDKASMMAAALAYYTAFSMAPLIIIVLAIAGFFIDQNEAQSEIVDQIEESVGPDAARFVGGLVENLTEPTSGLISSLLGFAALLWGALGVFNQLQRAIDIIWGVSDIERNGGKFGVWGFVRDRLISFSMLLIVGFLLLVSLIASTVLSYTDDYLRESLPTVEAFLSFFSVIFSLALITVLFMLIYRVLPHARLEWRDLWMGSFFTAVLFVIGQLLLGTYLGNSAISSTYGAAGALVLILLWVYYSAQIMLFGAEFIKVFAHKRGAVIEPTNTL